MPARQDAPRHVQRDHRGRDPRGLRPPARHRPEPRRRAAGAPHRGPPRGLHAQPAAVAQGPRRPVRRARAVGRRAAGRRAGARDPRLHRREYWTLEALLLAPDGTPFTADVVRIDGKALEIGDGDTAERHAAAIRATRPVVESVATRPSKRNPAPPFTTSTLQQEASRKLGFSPKRTMSVAQRLYEGVEHAGGPRRAHHLHADGLDGDRRGRHGRGPRRHSRPLGRALHRQGARLQDEVEGRPGGARVDPADQLPAGPGLAPGPPQARGAPPLPPHLAARDRVADGGQGARDHDGRAQRRPLRPARLGDADAVRRVRPRSTPRARTTRPRRPSRPAGCRRWPRATARPSRT